MPSKYTLYNDDSVCDLDSDAERLSSLVAREHTPADLCEQGLQLPGPPSTTRSDDPPKQNIAREPASAAELRESPRGIWMPSHTLHAEMHAVEESVPKVYVTDTDAESMICHNGSIYGSVLGLVIGITRVNIWIDLHMMAMRLTRRKPLTPATCARTVFPSLCHRAKRSFRSSEVSTIPFCKRITSRTFYKFLKG